MSITRAPRKESNFYILDKQISEDKRLSWAARGLLVYLLGKPDHWTVNVQALINETKAAKKSTGRDGVWNLLKELIEAGYCTRSQTRKDDGTLGEMSYTISETRSVPRTDFQGTAPRTDSPCTDQPFTANPPLVSTDALASTDPEQVLKGGKRAQAPAPATTFPKLDDLDAEQAEAEHQAAAEAQTQADRRLAAEQESAAKALEAAQAAEKAKAQAQVAAKPAKPAKAAVSRASAFPADFAPNEACTELAASLGVVLDGIDGELARFEDYHAANGTTFKDWQAGLRTWIRNAAKFAKRDQVVASAKTASRRAPANEDFANRDYGVRRKL